MNLQTKISLTPIRNPINYESKIVLLGSCFVENIGEKLSYFKFQHLINPFGIVFHPVAIEKLVTRAINDIVFTEEDIFFSDEQWHCFEVHSSLNTTNKSNFLSELNNRLKALKNELFSATHIVFTYGTSWVYRHIESDVLVANCHKIPQKKFLKEILTVTEIAASIDNINTLIKDINPTVTLINTISPVRHIKDGFVENTRSKAHLIAGLHEVIDVKNKIHYFPSYEIMMDELRDYRFYADDMIHPSKLAISIIWEKFNEVWIASETNELQKEIASIQSGLLHRPFNQESEAHQAFKEKILQKIEVLTKQIPYLKF